MHTGFDAYVFHGAFTPDAVGLWTFHVEGWGIRCRAGGTR